MKRWKLFVMAAVLLSVTSGCVPENGDSQGSVPSDKVVRVTVSMKQNGGGTPAQYEGVDFGLSLYPEAEPDGLFAYRNIRFYRTANGWDSDSLLLWKSDSIPYHAVAYAPFQGEEGEILLQAEVDLSGQTADNQAGKELLLAEMEVDPGRAEMDPSAVRLQEGRLPVHFERKLSQLVICCTYKDEFGGVVPHLDSLTIGGMASKAVYTFSDDTFSFLDTVDMVAVPVSSTSGNQSMHECLIIPQASSFSVHLYLGNREFVYVHSSDFLFEPGVRYRLDLSVGKDLVGLGKVVASQWQDGGVWNLGTE